MGVNPLKKNSKFFLLNIQDGAAEPTEKGLWEWVLSDGTDLDDIPTGYTSSSSKVQKTTTTAKAKGKGLAKEKKSATKSKSPVASAPAPLSVPQSTPVPVGSTTFPPAGLAHVFDGPMVAPSDSVAAQWV